MPSAERFTVNIYCDDESLQEYNVESDASKPKTTTCWIASEAGKVFHYGASWQTDETCYWDFVLWCDGVQVSSDTPEKYEDKNIVLKTVSYRRSGRVWSERVLQFSQLKTSGTPVNILLADGLNSFIENDQDAVEPGLGSITIKVYRAKIRRIKETQLERDTDKMSRSPVSEMEKALIGHRIVLGQEVSTPCEERLEPVETEHIDKEPFWTFTFYYRPKEFLQAEGYMPLTDNEDEIIAEMHVLEQRLEAIRAQKMIKRESPIVVGDARDQVIEISD